MELLKHSIFNEKFYDELTTSLKRNYRGFKEAKFKKYVYDKSWPALELKQRLRRYTEALRKFIDLDFNAALAVLRKVAPDVTDKFAAMVFAEYVELHGLEHYDESMAALEFFTRYGSAEFAVRPFIQQSPRKTMAIMRKWARSENEDVRRLASEGCRPRLPWAMALPEFKRDPSAVIALLKLLKADKSLYVRKSVANNLNDIAKDNPDVVVQIAEQWSGKNRNTDWIVKHGCRTLLKQGRPEIMQLFGFDHRAIKVTGVKIHPSKIKIGGDAEITFNVARTAKAKVKLRLEFGIDFMKKNGKLSRKIFQISESDFSEQKRTFKKKHSFKNLSTRTHMPGLHQLVVIANGKATRPIKFELG